MYVKTKYVKTNHKLIVLFVPIFRDGTVNLMDVWGKYD